MTYKESLTKAMTDMSADPKVCFIGYGVKHGKAMGTLSGVSDIQLIETPVAENLMVGIAIGMALSGYKPVVFFERADFLLNAADAIVNHLDKLSKMSRGEFSPGVIIRVCVGNKKKPLFTGETHTQDLSEAFAEMMEMPVCELKYESSISPIYRDAYDAMAKGESTMIVEYKDMI